MPQEKTLETPVVDAVDPTEVDPIEGGHSDLMEQASQYANAAREAHGNCEKGIDAVEELKNRKNGSGQ